MEYPLSVIGGSSTKNNIIKLLSVSWPLTTKKIYLRLKKEFNQSLTYQATHKALKELTENKILDKSKEGYLLNRTWIKELGNITKKIINDLDNFNIKRELKTFHKLVFDSHIEFIKFHLDFVKNLLKKEENVHMSFYIRHVPYPHVLSIEEINELKPHLKNLKWTIISKNSTVLDRWCAKSWESVGVNVLFDVNIPTDTILIVTNDYITNVYILKEAKEKWDEIFSVENINTINLDEMRETITNNKSKSLVFITKDKELSSLLKR